MPLNNSRYNPMEYNLADFLRSLESLLKFYLELNFQSNLLQIFRKLSLKYLKQLV